MAPRPGQGAGIARRNHSYGDSNWATAHLSCGHKVKLRPPQKTGTEILCFECNKGVKVVPKWEWKEHKPGWSARCTGCRFTKHFGFNRVTAEQTCVKHRHKYGHVVELLLGGETYHTFNGGRQQAIPIRDESIPF